MRFQLKYRTRKPFENKDSWKIKQNGISALVADYSSQAEQFINPGGSPVFKLHFLGGAVVVD
jgi:hypothetical protein